MRRYAPVTVAVAAAVVLAGCSSDQAVSFPDPTPRADTSSSAPPADPSTATPDTASAASTPASSEDATASGDRPSGVVNQQVAANNSTWAADPMGTPLPLMEPFALVDQLREDPTNIQVPVGYKLSESGLLTSLGGIYVTPRDSLVGMDTGTYGSAEGFPRDVPVSSDNPSVVAIARGNLIGRQFTPNPQGVPVFAAVSDGTANITIGDTTITVKTATVPLPDVQKIHEDLVRSAS